MIMEKEQKKKPRLKRVYSASELMRMKRPSMAFEGEWRESFGQPPTTGLWFVWGNSGNGKSSFVMKLAKYLCRFGKVFYNSIEEDKDNSFIKMLERNRMNEEDGRFFTCKLTLEQLEARMNDNRKERIYIIDSFQAGGFTSKGPMSYAGLVERHPDKLIIFVSRADGYKPKGRPADNCMWDAGVKIWVEGFRAVCKGRYDAGGKYFTIWDEGAKKYWIKDSNNGTEENTEAD